MIEFIIQLRSTMEMMGVGFSVVILAALHLIISIFPLLHLKITQSAANQGMNLLIDNNGSAQPLKRILFWTSYFGNKNWKQLFHDANKKVIQCDSSCLLSTDRRNPLLFDALTFHGRDKTRMVANIIDL